MAKELTITIKAKFAWWVKPYLALAHLGISIGMPLNAEIIGKDVLRGIKFEVVKNV